MAEPSAKNPWGACARGAARQALRSPITRIAALVAAGLFGLLVALPLPLGDRTAALHEAAASCQLLLVVMLGLHTTLSVRGGPRASPIGSGLESSAAVVGRWAIAALALIALAAIQLLVLQCLTVFVGCQTLVRVLTHSLAATLVVLAWAVFLGRRLGPLPGALALLILFLGASAWAEADQTLPSLAFLPDLALLGPVGHGLRGPPLPALLGYAALQALFPLALSAVLASIDATRGRRQRI